MPFTPCNTVIPNLGGGSGGHSIEDEGVPLLVRTILNFVGAGVTVSDIGGKTTVTVGGGAGISTTSNVGIGAGIAKALVGSDAPFKSFIATLPLSIADNVNDLTFTIALLQNADIIGSASIAYSKLNLTGAILNADLAGSIEYAKLVLTGAILNADLAGSIAYSKLSLTGAILNADLAGSIDATKINTGVVSNTEFNTLDGVTSAIQTQLNGKEPTITSVTYTDVIDAVMEIAEGSGALVDMHALVTQGSKISGFILPSTPDSTINFKFVCPEDLASVPNMRIIIYTITLAGNSSATLNLTVNSRYTGDTENADQSLNVNTTLASTVSNTIESLDTHNINPATDPVAGDLVTSQLMRDVSADNASDVIVVGIKIHIDRVMTVA